MEWLDMDQFRGELNQDPEFVIAARFWETSLKIEMGDRHCILQIQDGEVTGVNPRPGFYDPWKIKIGAPEKDWQQFLKTVPRPFYHDLFAASIHHDFVCEGDLESFFAYYPAIRRMFEVMRNRLAIKSGQGESS